MTIFLQRRFLGGLLAIVGLIVILEGWGVIRFLEWWRPLASDIRLVMRNGTCTVYFTPIESAYKPPRFDAPAVHLDVVGRNLSGDFLKAIRVEGHGRLNPPVADKKYLRYDGQWTLVDKPLGNHGNVLVPRLSCAASDNGPLRVGDTILVRSWKLPREAERRIWRVDDEGAALTSHQVDLYWGEDRSDGASDLFRPRNIPYGRVKNVTVYRVAQGAKALAVMEGLRKHHFGLVADILFALLPVKEAAEKPKNPSAAAEQGHGAP